SLPQLVDVETADLPGECLPEEVDIADDGVVLVGGEGWIGAVLGAAGGGSCRVVRGVGGGLFRCAIAVRVHGAILPGRCRSRYRSRLCSPSACRAGSAALPEASPTGSRPSALHERSHDDHLQETSPAAQL